MAESSTFAFNELCRITDKAVDRCYRPQAFESDAKRVEYLFGLYEKYTAGVLAGGKPKRKKQ